MIDNISNNLVCLFLKSNIAELNNTIVCEDIPCDNHIKAIKNVELALRKKGLHIKSPDTFSINEVAFYHTSLNNILVCNAKCDDKLLVMMYIPEILDIEQINFIQEYISKVNNSIIYIEQKKDEYFVSVDPNVFKEPNVKTLTHHLQNSSNLNK